MKALLLLLVLLVPVAAQGQQGPDPRKPLEKVDQQKVDAAIKKGADYLLGKYADSINNASWVAPVEIVVLTLHHSNVGEDNATFKKLLERMLSAKLEYTYRVALQAMALHRIDPVKYQDRIAHCAQWLVDTQCLEGEWGYPGTLHDPKDLPKGIVVEAPKKPEPPKDPKKQDTKPAWRIVRKQMPPKEKGDMSNAQFSLFGLRACQESGIDIPKETWALALRFQLNAQRPDGGWGYYFNDRKDKASYGSLTLAGLSAVAVCRYYLGMKDPKNDPSVQKGIAWFATRMDYANNPGATQSNVIDPTAWHFYYLYSIERAGLILGTDKFGQREWYPGGADWLIKNQGSDGHWGGNVSMKWTAAGDMTTGDTCLAILFLTKSTPPLVATGDGSKKPDPPPPAR